MDTKEKDPLEKQFQHILSILYKVHFERLCNSVMSYIQDEQDAACIVNDSFLAFADELSKILDASKFGNLLASYTEEKCQAFIKNTEHTAELDYPIQRYWENDMEREDWRLIVHNAVAGLPPKRKQIMQYLFWDGLTTDETAIKMSLSRQTVINQKNKAFRQLKSVIRNEASNRCRQLGFLFNIMF